MAGLICVDHGLAVCGSGKGRISHRGTKARRQEKGRREWGDLGAGWRRVRYICTVRCNDIPKFSVATIIAW